MVLWSVHHMLCPQEKDSSQFSPAPTWKGKHSSLFSNISPSHGLLSFTNCCSGGSSHGAQSFRRRLPQVELSPGWQVLAENLLQHGLISPQAHRSWQKSKRLWQKLQHEFPMGSWASFGHPLAPVWVRSTTNFKWISCFTISCRGRAPVGLRHRWQGNICSGACSASSTSFFTVLSVCRAVSHRICHVGRGPQGPLHPTLGSSHHHAQKSHHVPESNVQKLLELCQFCAMPWTASASAQHGWRTCF